MKKHNLRRCGSELPTGEAISHDVLKQALCAPVLDSRSLKCHATRVETDHEKNEMVKPLVGHHRRTEHPQRVVSCHAAKGPPVGVRHFWCRIWVLLVGSKVVGYCAGVLLIFYKADSQSALNNTTQSIHQQLQLLSPQLQLDQHQICSDQHQLLVWMVWSRRRCSFGSFLCAQPPLHLSRSQM